MKNKLLILAALLSLSTLNAFEDENSPIECSDPITGATRRITQRVYFTEILNEARRLRAQGNYRDAGRIFWDLAGNKYDGGIRLQEFNDMRAHGQWNDGMFARWNQQ